MGSLFRILMDLPVFRSILRPISRVLVGLIAIPIFRFLMRRVFRLQELDDELEKDLEEWFRGALLLLAASANMEHLLFGWMQKVDWLDRADWLTMGLRLMMAISVIEAMPDQELFAVLHPGPPKLEKGKKFLVQVWRKKWAYAKGIVCRHVNRSSPVLAMMCAIIGSQLPSAEDYEAIEVYRSDMYRQEVIIGWASCQQCSGLFPVNGAMALDALQTMEPKLKAGADQFDELERRRERWLVGWVCYLMAITQYLIIGLVTSRDRAIDVLSEFDRAVAERRSELIEEFKLEGNLPSDFDKSVPSADATMPKESSIPAPAATAVPAAIRDPETKQSAD